MNLHVYYKLFLQNIDNDNELDINSLSHQLTKIIQNAASKSCQSRQIKFGKKDLERNGLMETV